MNTMPNFDNQYPQIRMRRMRFNEFSRRLMQETVLSTNDLIYPLFVMEGHKIREPILSMPAQSRLSLDELLK
jgi:porphobilinogen synthase